MPSKFKRAAPSPKLAELKTLTGAAQATLALDIVEREKDVQALRAALDVLKHQPVAGARPALLARYAQLAADGVKRDAGTYLRAAILQALRSLAEPDDLPLLEQAARTYEYLPPTHSEEAGRLRSTALVVMFEVDAHLAAYHAVRLLNDPETSPLSGEPALTAARMLAAQENRWPLYGYVLYPPSPALSEVISECLKSLAGMPASLVPGLIEKYRESHDEAVLVGLVDLVLDWAAARGAHPAVAAFLRDFLGKTRQYAVYRYLVVRLVTSHNARFLPELARLAASESDPRRVAILEETLPLGAGDPHVKSVLAALRTGKPPSRRGAQETE